MSQALTSAGLIVVMFAWAITMQVVRKSVNVKRLVLIPAGFAVLALAIDHSWLRHLHTPVAFGFFALSVLLAVAMGLVRAKTIAVWQTESGWMSKGGWLTVVTWLATIAVRVAVALLGMRFGVAEETGEILLFVALTIATQNLIIAKRAGLLTRTPAPAEAAAGLS